MRDARLVLRVPSAEFTEAMDELVKVADLEASTSTSEDVTTQVDDRGCGSAAAREHRPHRGAARSAAASIRDVVAVEQQLTAREERLNSLLRQQAYLADQTSMSTITVHVERADAARTEPEPAEAGFLSGLRAGWDGLTTVLLGLGHRHRGVGLRGAGAVARGAGLAAAASRRTPPPRGRLTGRPSRAGRVSGARAGSPARTRSAAPAGRGRWRG